MSEVRRHDFYPTLPGSLDLCSGGCYHCLRLDHTVQREMSCFPEQCSPSKKALLLTDFLDTVSVLDLHIGLGNELNGVLLKEGSGLLYACRARAEGT